MASSLTLSATERLPQRTWLRNLLKHMRRYPSLWIGSAMLGILALLIAFAPIIARYPPNQQNLTMRLKPPSAQHLFGTDELGRDIFSRVLHGGRISLPAALIVVVVSLTVGGLLGAFAGFFGGVIDDAIMRVADVTLAFPAVVLALAISALLGPSLNNAILAACAVLWPEYARLIRSQVLVARTFEYVTAARSLGRREVSILLRHVLPNTWTPIMIKAALDVGGIILLVSALSFIGLGVAPPTAEWGSMVALGRTKFYQWWVATFPGLAILVSILACNLISEGLRNWLDPRM
ncbi:MAG: ABC transporter permease [Anaerolineae bacterium]|nr:ABC transporter permease [Anaerolineae bacterium]MDW8300481.1 ABC transporter permease [Anaerolineae bacterium]